MLQELSDESRRMGLKMNIANTKVMVVDNTPINVNNVLIEKGQGYVYLGQHYSLKEKNQDKEIQRIIMAGWAVYAKQMDIFKSILAICLKRHVYTTPLCCQLWHMVQRHGHWINKHRITWGRTDQNGKKHAQHNNYYKDRRTNIWVRERTNS